VNDVFYSATVVLQFGIGGYPSGNSTCETIAEEKHKAEKMGEVVR
jgi:hypothetical protein